MSKIAQIAQWVIDNRYPKNENDKISDFELFNELKDKIQEYTKECVIKSLEKASENAETKLVHFTVDDYIVDKESITNEKNIILL